ncbi:Amino acid permease [Balamuthia mandrillaris]
MDGGGAHAEAVQTSLALNGRYAVKSSDSSDSSDEEDPLLEVECLPVAAVSDQALVLPVPSTGMATEEIGSSSQATIDTVNKPAKRSLSAFRLALIGYFLTCGGPFGVESTVGAMGPLAALIALIVFPFLWSLPQALMAAELSLLIKENGGNIIWVQRAFGDFGGWVNAYNNIGNMLVSHATVVVLFVDYFPYSFTTGEAWAIKLAFLAVLIIVNIIGLNWLYRLSLLMMVVINLPFVLLVIMAPIQVHFDWSKWLELPRHNELDFGVFISTLAYMFGGFDNLGVFAGEVKGGRRSFIIGLFGILPINVMNYFFPVFFGFMVAPHYADWQSGYFTHVAKILSSWLGIIMLVGSAVSNFGAVSGVATSARIIWAMGRKDSIGHRKLPSIVSWSWQRHTGTVRPIAGILVVGLVVPALAAFPFDFLVQILLVLRIVNLLLEYGALIRLRYTEPDAEREFKLPGGKLAVWLLPVPTLLICMTMIALGSWTVALAGLGFNLIVIMLYFLVRLRRHLLRYWRVRNKAKRSELQRARQQPTEESPLLINAGQ